MIFEDWYAGANFIEIFVFVDGDLPLNFHPAAIRASVQIMAHNSTHDGLSITGAMQEVKAGNS
ncbi:hypothetical protein B5K05_33675 [Rhizobium phaseoli]|nr:hypothetical protein B5K05_33675 [Rhizobium phaseoli]RDJ00894.1 hypothetical protein B5K04_30985 [Rhizobium phaseoli]